MKNPVKTPNHADQSKIGGANAKKHEVNLQKNSTLYFQVGLILCLLCAYALFEMKFASPQYATEKIVMSDDDDFKIDPWKPETALAVEEPIKKKEKVIFKGQQLKPIDDDEPDVFETALVDPNLSEPTAPIDVSDVFDSSKFIDEDIAKPFNMINVERVPIYPGCEKAKNNDERRKCMSEKMSKLIQRKFNPDVASGYNLSGKQRISVEFRIDANGLVKDIKTRAPNSKLEKEAERVMNKVPKMQPGMQRERPVSVIYRMPIVFTVQD